MRRIPLLVLVLSLVALPTSPVRAGIAVVNLGADSFNPDDVSGGVGGDVVWDWQSSRRHNVRQDKQLFRSGDPTTDDSTTFTRRFSAGIFHYYCEVHGSPTGGMDGVVRVRPVTSDGPAGLPFTVEWATAGSNTGGAFDVQYRVGSGDWIDWKTDTIESSDVFGEADDPVAVESGVTYRFRARSQKSVIATAKVSRYSPKSSFTPS
jgi:plastocyanin